MGNIYFIETGDQKYVKIGYTVNVLKRASQIGVNMPGLSLIGQMSGTRALEKSLHQKFAAHREQGEWFRQTADIRAYIEAIPSLGVRASATDSEHLTPSEIDSLFRVITSPRDRAIFRLVYHRGLRSSEPGKLQLSDWNENDELLYVRRGKNSISRNHRLLPEEIRPLRAWLRKRGRAPGPLFPTRQMRAGALGIHRNTLDRILRDYCAAAKILPEKSHMHALRHARGVHMAASGDSLDMIQDLLGHRSLASTLVYLPFFKRRR